MSIQPLDMQIMVTQQVELSRLQHNAQHAPLEQQQAQGLIMQEQSKRDMDRVETTEKSEGKKIEKDEEKSPDRQFAGGGEGRGEKEEKGGQDNPSVKEPFKGNYIDVMK